MAKKKNKNENENDNGRNKKKTFWRKRQNVCVISYIMNVERNTKNVTCVSDRYFRFGDKFTLSAV